MQDFHGLCIVGEVEQQVLWHYIKEHRNLDPDFNEETLKRIYPK